MEGWCQNCEKVATHRVTLKNEDIRYYCRDHYNEWVCERLGYDYKAYFPPKTIGVFELRFKMTMQVNHQGITYFASRGRKGVEESYAVFAPFTIRRKDVIQFLKEKIAMSLNTASDDRTRLDDMSAIGVGTSDGFSDEEPYFIFKGRRINTKS